MQKKIVNYIKEIHQQPEEARERVMWVLVSFFMIIVIGVWWIEFSSNKPTFEKVANTRPAPVAPDLQKDFKAIQNLDPNAIFAPGDLSEKDKAEAETIARNYLLENKILQEGQISDLKLKKSENRLTEWSLRYQQYHKDVLVNESNIYFVIDKAQKKVTSYNSNYASNIKLDVAPKVTVEDAFETAKENLEAENPVLKSSQLTVYKGPNDKDQYYLSWKMNLVTQKPAGDYFYFIDAKNGSIIVHYNLSDK